MAQIQFAEDVVEDFDRIVAHLLAHDAVDAHGRIDAIVQAIDVLSGSPLIGRPAGQAMRELVIGHDAQGYVALYRYVPEIDVVFVLAIRGQREAGFHHD